MQHLQTIAEASRALDVSARILSFPGMTAMQREAASRARRNAYRVIATTIEELIEVLDRAAGDPDLEAVGAEDDFCEHGTVWAFGPGCVVSDPDSAVDDSACDQEQEGY